MENKAVSSSDPDRANFPHSNRQMDNNETFISFRKEDTGRNLSNFIRTKKSFPWKWKTYFYVCLFEWKTRESSTNNKLWWFQNDSTDFSRFFCHPTPTTSSSFDCWDRSEWGAQTKTNLFFRIMEKSLPRENKLIKIVSPVPSVDRDRDECEIFFDWAIARVIPHSQWGCWWKLGINCWNLSWDFRIRHQHDVNFFLRYTMKLGGVN